MGKRFNRRLKCSLHNSLKDCLREATEYDGDSHLIPYQITFQGKKYYVLAGGETGALLVFTRVMEIRTSPVSVTEIMKEKI